MHKHQCYNELKQKKKKQSEIFLENGSSCLSCVFSQFLQSFPRQLTTKIYLDS